MLHKDTWGTQERGKEQEGHTPNKLSNTKKKANKKNNAGLGPARQKKQLKTGPSKPRKPPRQLQPPKSTTYTCACQAPTVEISPATRPVVVGLPTVLRRSRPRRPIAAAGTAAAPGSIAAAAAGTTVAATGPTIAAIASAAGARPALFLGPAMRCNIPSPVAVLEGLKVGLPHSNQLEVLGKSPELPVRVPHDR